MDDLISRQAAIDALELTAWYHQNRDGEMVKGANSREHQAWYKAGDVYKVINDLPSAQPERKKGKWIEVNDAYNRISGRCSACGWEAHMYEDDVVGMPFCPSCGADMREEEHDES